MRVTVLLENTSISKDFISKHGLCLHIQTDHHSILFDLGPDDTFIRNAEKLNIDIAAVDTVIISHGHKDHGGGLEAFLKLNQTAKIYVNAHGFEPHYASLFKLLKVDVGLDQTLKNQSRIVYTKDLFKLDDEITLMSNVQGKRLQPKSNRNLLVKTNTGYEPDDFKHEQHLILSCQDKRMLVSGCSHTGIVNILNSAEQIGFTPNTVLAGLHLYNPMNNKAEALEDIQALGHDLKEKQIKLYTYHCTGERAVQALKPILGDLILTLKTGEHLEEMI